jgi:hypothetical protein
VLRQTRNAVRCLHVNDVPPCLSTKKNLAKECAQARASDRESDRCRQAAAAENALPTNGKEPPRSLKSKPACSFATATWASMPKAIMTGTVIKDVLPVTTLITLVKKNTAIKRERFASGTQS